MADDGGVTLRIDADTARYIAGIAKAAQANKALHDSAKGSVGHMKEMTSFAGEFASKVSGWSGPLTLAAGAMFVLDRATEEWKKKLETAKDAMNEIADLSSSIIGSGRGNQLEAIRSAIDAGAPGLSGAQKDTFYKSYNAANPKASIADIQSAAGSANTVGLLGRDVGSFAGLQGSLQRSGVANSGDLANYLQTFAGDSADKAAAMIAKNPGQAAQIAELFATGARGGRGAIGLLDRASADYVARGSRGDFANSLNRRVAGPGGADDLAFLLDAKNRAPAFRAGGLNQAMSMAMEDPDLSARIHDRLATEQAQDNEHGENGDLVRRHALAGSIDKIVRSQHGVMYNMIRDGRSFVPFYASDYDPTVAEKSPGYLKNAASEAELRNILKEISRNTAGPVIAPRFRRLNEGE